MSTKSIKERWATLQLENPKIRIRNAAKELNTSEMELLATQIGEGVTRLRPEFKEILREIKSLGKVMALTRNDECVHERKGIYPDPDFSSPKVSFLVSPDIDLRVFLEHWKKGFAVIEQAGNITRRSLQFFGKDGEAIHKIYLVPESNTDAFDLLIEKFKSEDQGVTETTEAYAINLDERLDEEIDVETFQEEWKNLKDSHDFLNVLKKHNLTRTQALRLAPNNHFAKKISNDSIVSTLEEVAEKKVPIMVFVGNKGVIQIHTGTINKTMWHGSWYNILDPDFNMHLEMSKIAQTWIVRKPTAEGEITAIEAYNEMGDVIVQFFGKRETGVPELEEWRDIVSKLK